MRKRDIIPLLLICAVALSGMLTACGGQSTGKHQPISVTKDIVAASGGSISNADGATFTIPAKALSGDAHVTLANVGPPSHAKGDPLDYISDSFTVTATPLTGTAKITLAHPATLQITTHPVKKGQDIIVAEMLHDSLGAVQLHHSLGTKGNTISSIYSHLGASEWGVFLPFLPRQPTPTEGSVLQVPWYDQSGVSWCVPTSLAEMLRYYDFKEVAGDPLNATFGPTTALANWEIAGQSHQPASGGAFYDESVNIGLPSSIHSDPGGGGARITSYVWDDDFFFVAPDDNPAQQDLTHLDFRTYVVLVNTGVLGLVDRKPLAVAVDAWVHSLVIVGFDSQGVFLHDSNGGIAVHKTWGDFFTQAFTYRQDGAGKPYEVRTIWTGVVSNLPIKPAAKREGSVVIARSGLTFTDLVGNPITLDWDGYGAHTAGYFFNDSADPVENSATHGAYAYRNARLRYTYRVANVSNIALTFHTVAELSGPNYGNSMVQQNHNVTVAPYAVSDDISGSFPAFPAGAGAIFDVRLTETNDATINQDVKFVRIDLRNASGPPQVHILAPANNSHESSEVPFQIAGSAQVSSGQELPRASFLWTLDGKPFVGASSAYVHIGTPGSHTLTFNATDAFGQSGSDTISIIVDPPTPAPTIGIINPYNGQVFTGVTRYGQVIQLVGEGSTGVTNFTWSDSLQGTLGTGDVLTTTLLLQDTNNCGAPTTHVLTLSGIDSKNQQASGQVTITLVPQCIH